MLKRYRRIVGQTEKIGLGKLTAIVAAAYFVVWTLLGVIVYGLGTVLAEVEMPHPMLASTVPVLGAICVLGAGAFQFTP
jgi:predicted metal-binding membrane protein